MFDSNFFEILVYGALIFFNLFCITGFIISIYLLVALGSIKNKVEELIDSGKDAVNMGKDVISTGKEAIYKVQDAAISVNEAGFNIVALLAPLFFRRKSKSSGLFSRLFK